MCEEQNGTCMHVELASLVISVQNTSGLDIVQRANN
jgi:hypothetical protein